jgi:hypothetical protein
VRSRRDLVAQPSQREPRLQAAEADRSHRHAARYADRQPDRVELGMQHAAVDDQAFVGERADRLV